MLQFGYNTGVINAPKKVRACIPTLLTYVRIRVDEITDEKKLNYAHKVLIYSRICPVSGKHLH